jgi:hypothetical protein
VALRDLSAREIDHVAKEPADWRAHHMQDVEAAGHVWCSRSVNDPGAGTEGGPHPPTGTDA